MLHKAIFRVTFVGTKLRGKLQETLPTVTAPLAEVKDTAQIEQKLAGRTFLQMKLLLVLTVMESGITGV